MVASVSHGAIPRQRTRGPRAARRCLVELRRHDVAPGATRHCVPLGLRTAARCWGYGTAMRRLGRLGGAFDGSQASGESVASTPRHRTPPSPASRYAGFGVRGTSPRFRASETPKRAREEVRSTSSRQLYRERAQ